MSKITSQSVTGNGKTAHTPWRVEPGVTSPRGTPSYYSVRDSQQAVVADYIPSKELADLIASTPDLSNFKAYVHRRLDEAGIPVDPESPHKAQGCRIGGRLDIVLASNPELPPHANDPAFPSPDCGYSTGMSLRDHFAAAALTGMISFYSHAGAAQVADKDADSAYTYADAMLKRRAKP